MKTILTAIWLALALLLTGCGTIKSALVRSEVVTLKPAQTNEVQVLTTNYVEVTRYVTNLVTVVEASVLWVMVAAVVMLETTAEVVVVLVLSVVRDVVVAAVVVLEDAVVARKV